MYISQYKRTPFAGKSYKQTNKSDMGKFLIDSIANDFKILPSGFVLGCGLRSSQEDIEHMVSGLSKNIHTTIVSKLCNSGLASIIYGMQYMHFHDAGAFLCASVDLHHENHQHYAANENNKKLAEAISYKYDITHSEEQDYHQFSKQNYHDNKHFLAEDFAKYLLHEDELSDSGIADGAACMLLSKRRQSDSCAEILGVAEYSGPKENFVQAPIFATSKLFKKLNLHPDDIKIYEVHETFAIAPLAFLKAFSIAPEKINVYGGASALGHASNASGLRMVVHLIRALKQKGGGIGVVTMYSTFGESVALALRV